MTVFLASNYALLKHLHFTFIAISIGFFCWRYVWMLRDNPKLKATTTRIIAAGNDTLLLFSGISLMFATGQFPGSSPWLTEKLLAVVAYIALGWVALHWEVKSKFYRTCAFVGALGWVYWVAKLALTKTGAIF